MSNMEARQRYLNQEAIVPQLIDPAASLEQQARQSFDLRNVFRSAARDAVDDQGAAEILR
jgi:filamentous hemagglutinin